MPMTQWLEYEGEFLEFPACRSVCHTELLNQIRTVHGTRNATTRALLLKLWRIDDPNAYVDAQYAFRDPKTLLRIEAGSCLAQISIGTSCPFMHALSASWALPGQPFVPLLPTLWAPCSYTHPAFAREDGAFTLSMSLLKAQRERELAWEHRQAVLEVFQGLESACSWQQRARIDHVRYELPSVFSRN